MMRGGCLLIACGVVIAAWSGAAAQVMGPFSSHMLVHMAVVAAAAPLAAAALAGSRFDPARAAPRLFAPIPASLLELAAVWAWHVPALHEAARTSAAAYTAEQATFLTAGLLLWVSAAGGDGSRGVARSAAGVGALLFTSMHMTLLGALFALAPRPLYGHSHGGAALALHDQHSGGVIMLLVGGGSYLLGGLWLMRRVLDERRPEAGAAA